MNRDPLALSEAILLATYAQRFGARADAASKVAAIMAGLFDRQIALINDPSRRKAAKCGRRSGKTHAVGAYLYKAAVEPAHAGLMVPYIALTKGHARRLLWPVLQKLDRDHELGLAFNQTELIATLPNGSKIWLTGADKPAEVEKLRGGAYPLVCIDEAASFGPILEYLVEDVLDAALEDYDGTLCLIGSPSAACAGLFYDVTTQAKDEDGRVKHPGWATHSWTVLDNPMFPRWAGAPNWRALAQLWLANKQADKGWSDDHPVFRREWLGQWVRDMTSLVYRYLEVRNSYTALPPQQAWEFVLGIDLGFDDETAFEVLAFCRDLPTVYEVETIARTGMIADDIAQQIRDLQKRYVFRAIKADTGGLGKMIVEEIQRRFHLPVTAAEKKDKHSFIELLNSDMQMGNVRLREGSPTATEMSLLQWDEDHRKEDERFSNHRCDAFLYAWRECKHYLHIPKEPLPEYGTPDHWDREQRIMEQTLAKKMQARQTHDWWDQDA